MPETTAPNASGQPPTSSTWPAPDSPSALGAGPLGQQPPPHRYPPAPPVPPRRGRGGLAAAVIATSLVVGGSAGTGGAAAWTQWGPHSGGAGSTTAVTTSTVADRDVQPAPAGSVEEVAARVLPSVVKIDVTGQQGSGSGSGIILSSDGRILTNNHVVEVAGQGGTIQVDFNDGSHAEATVVGTDPLTDTAVIQAKDVSGLTPATIGRSENLAVGQSVVAVGSPFGLDATVTSGIVSALNRPVNVGSDGQGNVTAYPAVQTDAAINPGNSGGPLVDLNGDVVGINASIRSGGSSVGGEPGSIGLGFAIPIDEVMPVVDQMVQGETPTHARLGVSVDSSPQAATVEGARLAEVPSGTPAAAAGLKPGDVITRIDDRHIQSSDGLIATIRAYRPGDKVTVTYERGTAERTASVTLASDAESANG